MTGFNRNLTSLLTMSSRSGILTSALTSGILSTSSGKGLCLTLYLIPTSLLGVGRPSGTNTCCGRREVDRDQAELCYQWNRCGATCFTKASVVSIIVFHDAIIYSVISPSDWPELLWVGERAAWSRHVCQPSLGSKLSLMDWDLWGQRCSYLWKNMMTCWLLISITSAGETVSTCTLTVNSNTIIRPDIPINWYYVKVWMISYWLCSLPRGCSSMARMTELSRTK